MRELSVVIPFAGSVSFCHTLKSLAAQTLPPKLFEIIIVAESAVASVLPKLGFSGPAPRVVLYKRPRGFGGHSAGIMRNIGVRIARSAIVVLVDSDCILREDCLREHLRLQRRHHNCVICGAWHELPVEEQSLLEKASYGFAALFERSGPDYREGAIRTDGWQNLYSGNVSLSRRLFMSVGGFDEEGHRCHDMDLGYRLFRRGTRFRYSPECRALHIEHPRSVITRQEQARGWKRLGEKYPEIAAYAEDCATILNRAYSQTAQRCESKFGAITSRLPGIRSKNTWIVPAWYPRVDLNKTLRGFSYVVFQRSCHRKLLLRFERNCWDYSVVQAELGVLTSPEVSVLLTTYNSERTLERALHSVLYQTLQSFEVIILDDASSDGTEGIARSFCADGRIRVFANRENHGLARSLNRALEMAKAPIVVQLDADDWLEADALEQVVRRFRAKPSIGAIYARAVVHEGDAVFVEKGKQVESDIELLTYKGVQGPRAYRTDVLKAIGGWSIHDIYEGRFFEDRLTLARVHRAAGTSFINRTLYHADVTRGSLSRKNPHKTAIAKFLILHAEANRARLLLNARFQRLGLSAEFASRRVSRPRRKWTVIIPSHGREDLLRYALRSWLESDALCGSIPAELIVVDDGSLTPLEGAVGIRHPCLRFHRLASRQGPANARNLGVSVASHAMLFFSDGDHVVPKDILGSHEMRHAASPQPTVVVGGLFGEKVATSFDPLQVERRTLRKLLEQLRFDEERFLRLATAAVFGGVVNLPGHSNGTPVWQLVAPFCFADSYLAGWAFHAARHGDLVAKPLSFLRLRTGNVSMSAKTFHTVGGFDANMPVMEDWEFGVRCEAKGVRIVTAPEAEAYHQLHPSDPNRHQLGTQALKYFERKHPSVIGAISTVADDVAVPGLEFIRSLGKRSGGPATVLNRIGKRQTTCMSLTFDDGPHPFGSFRMLEVIRKFNSAATFFVMGSGVARHRELLREIVNAGCEVGVHGWNHEPIAEQTTEEISRNLRHAVTEIRKCIGIQPRFCRPAYGIATASYMRAASKLRLQPVGWHVSSHDWSFRERVELVIDLATSDVIGKVLLFHDGTGDLDATAAALTWLLDASVAHGVPVVSLSEYARRAPLPSVPA